MRVFTRSSLILLGASTPLTVSSVDLEHGRAQVKQMLIDRPLFRFYRDSKNKLKEIKPTDAPYRWAVKQFGGAATGEPIVWMPQEPARARSDYIGRWKYAPGFIRVSTTLETSDGRIEPQNFAQGWECIVYELHNISHSRTMAKLLLAASNGQLSREEFLWEGPRCEYEAWKANFAFYREVWKPWVRKVGAATDPGVWNFENRAESYEEWLRRISVSTNPNGYPWKYYGEVYDAEIARMKAGEQ